MSELPRIDDSENLEAWLKTRPVEESQIIAYRTAMRVVPIWSAWVTEEQAHNSDLTALLVLRVNLTSGVFGKYPTTRVREAIRAARIATDASYTAAASARSAAFAATRAARHAADASYLASSALAAAAAARVARIALIATDTPFIFLWRAIKADIHQLVAGINLHTTPLWPGNNNPLSEIWDASKPTLRGEPGGEFWIDWYQRALDGRHQNWPLLRDITLIDNKLWEQGGEALEQAIYSLIAEQGLRDTAYGEDIIVDPDTLNLRAIPHNDVPPDYLRDILDKIGDTVRILPNNAEGNAYIDLPEDVETLQDAGNRYADRPRMLYSVVSRVQRRIERRIDSGDCVDDAFTADLRATVAEIRRDLLAYSPEVRESVKLQSELNPKAEPPRNAEQIEAVVDAVAANFENYPHDEMPEDIRIVNSPDAPLEDRKEAAVRTAGRLLRVHSLLLDKTLKVGRDVTKALKEIGAVADGVTTVATILSAAIWLLFYLMGT